MLNEEMLEKLITKGHINVIERKVFEDNRIPVSDIITSVKSCLKSSNFFPPNSSVWNSGQMVYEGVLIEKVSNSKYLLHFQQAHPIIPTELVESRFDEYNCLEEVVEKYIQLNWGSNIDGIEIDYKA